MRFLTFALAALTLGSGAAFAWLVVGGDGGVAARALLWLGVGSVIAAGAEALSGALARQAKPRRGRRAGRLLAAAAGLVPIAVLLGWEGLVLARLEGLESARPAFASWLVSYGVATAPWIVVAMLAAGHQRTVCGIHAYTGQLYYLLLSLVTLVLHAPVAAAWAVLSVAALPPVLVGALVAYADPQVLPRVVRGG